jgi:hypothetical protein
MFNLDMTAFLFQPTHKLAASKPATLKIQITHMQISALSAVPAPPMLINYNKDTQFQISIFKNEAV